MPSAEPHKQGTGTVNYRRNGRPRGPRPRPILAFSALVAAASATSIAAANDDQSATIPGGVRILGSHRIPDRTAEGFSFVATYELLILTGNAVEGRKLGRATWSLADPSIGLITAKGEILAYDISPDIGEVSTTLTASLQVGGVTLAADPFEVTVFDRETLRPDCLGISIRGPDRVTAGSVRAFVALVSFEHEAEPRAVPDDMAWRVTVADDGSAGGVPATISDRGLLTTTFVLQDTEIVIEAILEYENGTPCAATMPVVVEKTASIEHLGESDRGTLCGAFGAAMPIGFLYCFVATRRRTRRIVDRIPNSERRA